jgi:hypothetical protein
MKADKQFFMNALELLTTLAVVFLVLSKQTSARGQWRKYMDDDPEFSYDMSYFYLNDFQTMMTFNFRFDIQFLFKSDHFSKPQ